MPGHCHHAYELKIEEIEAFVYKLIRLCFYQNHYISQMESDGVWKDYSQCEIAMYATTLLFEQNKRPRDFVMNDETHRVVEDDHQCCVGLAENGIEIGDRGQEKQEKGSADSSAA